jgi:hypothetical protein
MSLRRKKQPKPKGMPSIKAQKAPRNKSNVGKQKFKKAGY